MAPDTTRESASSIRRIGAWLSLTILGLLLALSLLRFAADMSAWPFVAAQHSGDDYASLVTAQSEPDNGMSIGVVIRALPDYQELVALEVPDDLDRMRDPIQYGDRILSPILVRAIDDMVAGKIVSAKYDSILTTAQVDAIDARDDLKVSGPTVLVPHGTSDTPFSYRLFTDPARTRFFLIPSQEVAE